jgi:glycosyltransferase involved in cell wall biosynthesis
MHILMLTPQVPYPPRQGTALRNWGILRGLAAQHRVSLLTFAAPDQPTEPPALLSDIVERVAIIPQPTRTTRDRLRDLLTNTRPDLTLRLESPTFRQQMQTWLDAYAFDWIQVEGLEMAPYLDVLARLPSTVYRLPRIAFDDHNCEYVLQKRAGSADLHRPRRWPAALYSAIQWRRLRRYEATVCRRADLVIAVSEADAQALRHIAPGLDPLVIPNGITVAEYAAFTGEADLHQPAFVFTGTMDFRPNVDGALWFAAEVWPRIRAALPDAHLYLVGRHPHRRLDVLRQTQCEDSRREDSCGVIITGSVPDTRPYINAATVYVVPLLIGGGTRLKLLEATSMGKAIVSTTLGAEGFAHPEKAMHLADNPAAFAEACIHLARDAVARVQLEARARTYAHAYDWDVLLPPLLARLD